MGWPKVVPSYGCLHIHRSPPDMIITLIKVRKTQVACITRRQEKYSVPQLILGKFYQCHGTRTWENYEA